MDNHPIPQDVTGFQFRLIGDMTIKQFAYLAAGAVLGWIMFSLPIFFLIKAPLGILFAGTGALLAFIPIGGRPADTMVIFFLKALFSPSQYVYQQAGATPLVAPRVVQQKAFVKKEEHEEKKEEKKDEKVHFEAFPAALSQSVLQPQPQPLPQIEEKTQNVAPLQSDVVTQPPSQNHPVDMNETQKEMLTKEVQEVTQELSVAKEEEKIIADVSKQEEAHQKVEHLESDLQTITQQKQALEQQLVALEKQLADKKQQVFSPSTAVEPHKETSHVRKVPASMGTSVGKNGKAPNAERWQQIQDIRSKTAKDKVEALFGSLSKIKESYGVEKFRDGDDFKKFIKSIEDGRPDYEVFAVKMFNLAFPGEYNPGINPFENIRYALDARDTVREAMRKVLITTEHLDEFEAQYAEEWAYTMTYHTGISARNDTQGIGHDAWSKITNTEFYRLRQTGGGNYPGNLDNLYGIHRLGVDFWEGVKVQPDGSNSYSKTLYEELTGLERDGDSFVYNINKNMEGYEFAGNAMRQFYADHVYHVIELFIDITQKQEFNLEKLIKHDNFHRLVWNNEEMEKMINSTWKHLRYGFDNGGILYDANVGGWWYDEHLSSKKGEEGQVKRDPHYGITSIRNLMFSKKLRDMDMYKRKDVSSWSPTELNYGTKMGRNVFAYLIAAQLREHTRRSGHYKVYSADEVEVITEAFLMYAARVVKGMDDEAIVLSGFFNSEEMMKILVAAHSVLWVLYMKEYGFSMSGGFLFGLFDALVLIMKNAGAGIKL